MSPFRPSGVPISAYTWLRCVGEDGKSACDKRNVAEWLQDRRTGAKESLPHGRLRPFADRWPDLAVGLPLFDNLLCQIDGPAASFHVGLAGRYSPTIAKRLFKQAECAPRNVNDGDQRG